MTVAAILPPATRRPTARWKHRSGSCVRDRVPPTEALAAELANATGLQVTHQVDGGEPHARIEVPLLGEALFDIERAGDEITFYSHIPAHPCLWENLDRVLSALGGRRVPDATCWRPDGRFRHVRKAWGELSAAQQWLLRFPTVGATRFLDRFV